MGSDNDDNYKYTIDSLIPSSINSTKQTKVNQSIKTITNNNNNKITTIFTKVDGSTEKSSYPPGSPLDFKKGVSTNGEVKMNSFNDRPLDYYGADPIFRGKNLILYNKDFTKNSTITYPKKYERFTTNNTTSNGSWANKKQQKQINFGKDTFSLGINDEDQKTIPTYNLKDNTIQNFTLPNGQNLLSFLKENNVQNGDNVEIKITKDGVKLIKKK